MKMFFSFLAGMAVCSLLLFTMKMIIPVSAATDESGSTSGNNTSVLLRMLPDIERIYHTSLTLPFIKAESKIYDEDIAEYYRALMDKTGLAPSEAK
jgi:hypothetical protein